MKQKILAAVLAMALLAVPVAAVGAVAAPEIAAPSAVLIERTSGTVLYEKNAHDRLPPASVTKIMTLLLVMESLESGRISWDDTVTASEAAAAKGGSQIYLEIGEQMPLRDMLKAVVVSSANDCAAALAEHIAGSEEGFVAMMNARAAELGMEDTHFVNCTGLDDGIDAAEHVSSAYDIALMSRALLGHAEIREYTTIWMDTVRDGTFGLSNTNKLVRFYPGATGLKTGFTSGAGYCLAASAERDGIEFIAVVLHCDTSQNRFNAAKALLDYGFAGYSLAEPLPEEPLPEIPVLLGDPGAVRPVPSGAAPVLIGKGQTVTRSVELPESLEAPVEAGQLLGSVTVRAGSEVVATIPLIAGAEIGRLGFFDLLLRVLRGACFC